MELRYTVDVGVLGMTLYLIAVIIMFTLIYDERDPSTTLAWLLILTVLPGVGLVLYFMFGRNWRRLGRRNRRMVESVEMGHRAIRPLYERHDQSAAMHLREYPLSERLAHAIQTQNGNRLLPCAHLEIMTSGAEKFARLFADIEAAERFVHLEYFIWEHDELTADLCELLALKVAQGVEVRILYDWVGSLPYGKSQLKTLAAAGAHVRADAPQWQKFNYRNHRKIAVIDGRIGYTGGMNVGQEYIDGGSRFESWRDTHLRFGGPLVLEMQRLFSQRWYETTGERLFSAEYFTDIAEFDPREVVWAQLATSGPESHWETIRQAFVLAIASAETRVRVQSPYFVPDQGVMDALVSQSLARVDVRFMMTGHPDKKLPWWAAFSYLRTFARASGRAYQFEAGFFHAKSLTIDGRIAAFGTANFDIRSFMLHDELMIFFYDEGVAGTQDAIFDADMSSCRSVTADDLHDRGRLFRFRSALARLTSRLM
jgi:cardiolipin synthase